MSHLCSPRQAPPSPVWLQAGVPRWRWGRWAQASRVSGRGWEGTCGNVAAACERERESNLPKDVCEHDWDGNSVILLNPLLGS